MKKIILTMILSSTFVSVLSAANLSGDARITRELTAAAVADEIRNKCDSISASMGVGLRKAMALKSYALGIGATEEEISAFLESEQERARIMKLRDEYLSENGVVAGDSASYCALGEREIAQESLIGSLIHQ